MIDDLVFIVTLLTTIGCGLVAGVFFAFSTFVVQSLARLPANEGIAAMQAINVVVVNSIFIAVFLATGVACIGLIIGALLRWHAPSAMYVLLGGALYLIGSLVVTMVFNVPLNNALADLSASSDSASQWASYLANWMLWNHVRTGASAAAMVTLILALVRNARVAH